MARKQAEYGVRMILEDGTPLTKENMHLTRIHSVVTDFQTKSIIKSLNQMPKELGEQVFEGLTQGA